jgi:hypothetical protein
LKEAKMKKLSMIFALVVLSVFAFQTAFSQSANQLVTIEVKTVNKINISGPVSLTIDNAIPGGAGLQPVSNNSTSYNLTHNGSATGKITASINSGLPSGITLQLTLASTLGTSKGIQNISNATVAVDVVEGIIQGKDATQMITYNFSATPEAGVFASTVKTITLTVTD